MEIVGEFLGIDTDKGIYTYFKRHYGGWFPKLAEVHRTTFTRQAANLWKVKEKLWGSTSSAQSSCSRGKTQSPYS